jgi:2-polyprenyl-3-methyl-5-hydroxy-6-metoxy-1,4-benzoquinol methylase
MEQQLDEAESWLRGYFNVERKPGEARSATPRRWKNIDFLRLRDVALQLADPRQGRRILDVGCANGPTMIYCALQGAEVYGQDLDPQMIAEANEQLRRHGLKGEAVVGDATALTFPKDFFDAVISSDFVEHIDEPAKIKMFKEALRVLKPGGVLITKTPNLAYLQASLFYKRLNAIKRFQNPMRLRIAHTAGTENPHHIGLTTRWGLTRCLVAAGFLNYEFVYAPLRRFGASASVDILSAEVPLVRDMLCEDLFCRATKPIVLSHFPD